MLRSNDERYHRSIDNLMLAIRLGKEDITGPVHGFISSCLHLAIEIGIGGHGLTLQSPYGTEVTVRSADRKLYNLVIRDSIRHAIVDGLQQRTTTPGTKRYRKDMGGAGPHLDIKAARVNLDKPLKKDVPSLWTMLTHSTATSYGRS